MQFISLTLQSDPTVTVYVNVQNIASFNWDSSLGYSLVVYNFPDSGTGTAHTINVTENAELILAKIRV